jgi:hypothetical protein
MITDEEFAQLPEEPELAFVEFERKMRDRLRRGELQAEEAFGPSEPHQREYISQVLAAARALEIARLSDAEIPLSYHQNSDVFKNFLLDVDGVLTEIRLRYTVRIKQTTVSLNESAKSKIHHHIGQIRTAIEAAGLPIDKRDSLYAKLNHFVQEVDRSRTGLQSGMAVFIAICDGIGQGFTKLEPARKWFDPIAALMGRAKDAEDSRRLALSGPPESKRLAAPPTDSDDLDDEIPF